VKNQAGNTVFAVYNEGIRAYVGNGNTKGAKGGFSVGGYDATKGSGTIYDLFTLNTDSARIYVDSKPNLKGARGGFSVGGYDMTKGTVQDYLDISKDSARIYVDSNPATKGAKGGFAVGGYDMTKDGLPVQNYLDVTPATTKIFTADTVKGFAVGNVSTGTTQSYLKLTPSNYLIGQDAGKSLTTGTYNSLIGFKSGISINTGNSNTFLGYKSGYTNTSGANNTFISNSAGYYNSTGINNVFIGPNAGYKNTSGYSNVFIGVEAGRENTTGERGVNIGIRAGLLHSTGEGSVCIGYEAGSGFDGSNDSYGEVTGQSNTYIGLQAGKTNLTGSYNTAVGFQTGIQSRYGSRNTYLGAYIQRENIESYYPNDNVYVGYGVAYYNQEGYQNVMIGSSAGQSVPGNSEPSGSVFIGYNAGQNETGSNKLYIDDSNTASPLIWGDFNSRFLNFNGNVGIGTTSPLTKLHIVTDGTIRAFRISGTASNNYAEAQFAGDAREYRIGIGGSALSDGSANKFYIWDNNAAAYRMVLDASGNVGIGTTSPLSKLHIEDANPVLTIRPSGGVYGEVSRIDMYGTFNLTADKTPRNFGSIEVGCNAGSTWGGAYVRIMARNSDTGPYEAMRVDNWTGNVGIATATPGYKLQVNGSVAGVGAYVNTSDVRFKKDIEPITGALEKIMALQGITFNWDRKADPDFNFDDRNHLGFSAQDLEKIVPQVVSTANDKMQTKSVAYGDLVPLLTEAIKEQQQQIESQKQENQQLKSELQAMKERLG
jgi:hypothetical protein